MTAPLPAYRIATPRASVLIDALRGLGYSTAAALADIIDNSIAAEAGAVDVDFAWNGTGSRVTIRDNGRGMSEGEIEQAMRLGAKDPREQRRADDLGRFGLGLKTASFSQCKRLTVVSKQGGAIHAFRWDLDVLRESNSDEWRLLIGTAPGSEEVISLLDDLDAGTLVVWQEMDRVVLPGFTAQDFLDLIDDVERHLSLVFHRYISRRRLVLRLNGREIAPTDPFLSDHPATWASPRVVIRTSRGQIVAQGYVLPHRDLIDEKTRQSAGGTHGWTAHQGFYVYRNERLLVAGSWLGLGQGRPWPKDEPHRLARIQLDIANSSDEEWKIDVRKSTARPPPSVRPRLLKLAEDVRERARRVFVHRGKAVVVGSSKPVTQVWQVERLAKGMRYRIDEAHPIVAAALQEAGSGHAQVRAMLRTIEETLPVQRIWLDTAEGKETPQTGFAGQPDENLIKILRMMFSNLVDRHGMSSELARERLLHTEPFQNYPDLVASVCDEMGEGNSLMTTEEDNRQKVIKFVQELLSTADKSTVTPELISEKIDQVVQLSPPWGAGLDRAAVTDELIRRFSLWVGQDTTLSNDEGHLRWMAAERKRDWRYWQRYREWLERRMALSAVEALDTSTDHVLGLLEDPLREGAWDRRGLVVGHVQSGKTGHYIGLVNKAADAGYKIIIVLAGLHNNLRSQTQLRLDEGFLGYETKPDPEELAIIGVGEIDGDPAIRPNFATNRSNNGDFTSGVARNLGITPEQRPWLFVVKKNKTVLERLLGWITHHVTNTVEQQTGRRIVTNLPLLLIDDEADNASVDTGETVLDADGNADEDHQPTAINRRIRRILFTFTRSAYVGYTATPFANIFIHERGATKDEGPDLFPSAFIVNLAAPSTYVGPAKVFGIQKDGVRDGALPLIIPVTDAVVGAWMPSSHKNGHQPLHENQDVLPPSLLDAIDDFLLAATARQIRLGRTEHSSMLIHVTRFTVVQDEVHRQVEDRVRQLRQRLTRGIESAPLLASLQKRWEDDFMVKSTQVARLLGDTSPPSEITWSEIVAILPDVVSDIEVRRINGTSKDALDYADQTGPGLRVIAIGGDKLARGLTLEGLCTSYFLRASRMYDTLMQMGRWFGYRPGYLDLCRLYTTPDLIDWFGHIADAAEELRDEFDFMAASGATPREYGLKVQSHSVLMVTSRLKMRAAKNLMLSFSGQLLETILLYRDERILAENLRVANALLSQLTKPEENPKRARGEGRTSAWDGYLWSDVPAVGVIQFLLAYRTHPEVHKVNSQLLAEFIESMAQINELTHWTVVLIGGGEGGSATVGDKYSVRMLKRKADTSPDDRYAIGRLMSPRDEAIDLNEAAWLAALDQTRKAWHADPGRRRKTSQEPPDVPNGPAVRHIRGFGAEGVEPHPDCGVLFLYVLDPALAELPLPATTPPVVAMAVSFPGSKSGIKVEYKVNNVEWESWQTAYGSAE